MIDTILLNYKRWTDWSAKSINRRIFSAFITISSLTALIKLVSVGKEMFVASTFGTRDDMDAYLIAFMIPSFGVGVVANSFNAALIPTFIKVRECEGHAAAQRLFSSATVFSITLLGLICALMGLGVPYFLPVFAAGFAPAKLGLAQSLCFCLLPILVLSGLSATWSAVLNAGERFALAAVAPIMRPLALVGALLLAFETCGIYAMVIGTIAGLLLELCLLAKGLHRRGFSVTPRWHGMSPDLKQVIKQYLPMIAGVFFMSSANLVDQSMAAMLPSGSVSILNYGDKVSGLIMELCATAMGTAVLPYFSRMAAVNDWPGIQHTFKSYARLILLASVIPTLLLIYLSEPLAALMFQRGAFTSADTHLVAHVQSFSLLQVPVYMLVVLVVRLLSSLKANYVLMWCAIINFCVNIVLDYVFMQWFGVAGIALSTVFVYVAGFSFSLYMLLRILRSKVAYAS